MKKLRESNQSGRSMIEMLGVLAIIGVLSVGGISGYSKAMAKYKTNKTLDQLSLLITNIRTLYANQISYAGLNNAAAVSFELVTQEMAPGIQVGSNPGGAVSLVNPFGGAVTIAVNNANPAQFTVAYAGLDRQTCITIATADWGGSASSGLVDIQIGNTTYSWANKKAAITYTDDEYYFNHKGKFDLFNFSRKLGGNDKSIYDEFVMANKFKNYYAEDLSTMKFIPLKTNLKNIFAYARSNGDFSVIVIGNLDFTNPAKAVVKVRGLSSKNKYINLRLTKNIKPELQSGKIVTELNPGDIQVLMFKNFTVKG